jgi:DNA-binding transcriptional regulator/RsmH inhibitor MraZ
MPFYDFACLQLTFCVFACLVAAPYGSVLRVFLCVLSVQSVLLRGRATMNFFGHYKRKLDSQSRLVLPKAYSLGFPSKEILLVKGAQNKCIVAMPPERLASQSGGGPNIAMGAFQKISIKSTLRFTVPNSLRALIESDEVWFIGTADRLIICDESVFQSHFKPTMENEQAIAGLAEI